MNVVFSASAALFRRIDRGDEHYADRGAGGVEGFVRLLVDIVRFIMKSRRWRGEILAMLG